MTHDGYRITINGIDYVVFDSQGGLGAVLARAYNREVIAALHGRTVWSDTDVPTYADIRAYWRSRAGAA